MKINFPLLALATGAFGIGITEFAPMGLLPDMAEGLGVSIPAAGLLVSAGCGALLRTAHNRHPVRRQAAGGWRGTG